MDTTLPVVYLLILVTLLSGLGWAILRQILKTRKSENALGRLQTKLASEKGTTQEYYELGSIYLDKKVYTQAIALFQKALKAAESEGEENIAPIYNGLGYAHFAQAQYDLAIRQYKEALKFQPNYVTALNNLAHAYERKKLLSQALETYEQALESDPRNHTAKRRAQSLRKRFVAST